MKRLMALFVLSLAGTGCVQTYWTKPDFNQADWDSDRYECERDMRQSDHPQDFFERCLVAKGYDKRIGPACMSIGFSRGRWRLPGL